MARGQRLVEAPRPPGGRSTAWYVEAFYLGDFAATAASKLRAKPTH
jgi:hypothetical protein